MRIGRIKAGSAQLESMESLLGRKAYTADRASCVRMDQHSSGQLRSYGQCRGNAETGPRARLQCGPHPFVKASVYKDGHLSPSGGSCHSCHSGAGASGRARHWPTGRYRAAIGITE